MSFCWRSQGLAWMPRRLDCLIWVCAHASMKACKHTKQNNLGSTDTQYHFKLQMGEMATMGLGSTKAWPQRLISYRSELSPKLAWTRQQVWEDQPPPSCLFQAPQWVTGKRRLTDPLLEETICRSPLLLRRLVSPGIFQSKATDKSKASFPLDAGELRWTIFPLEMIVLIFAGINIRKAKNKNKIANQMVFNKN